MSEIKFNNCANATQKVSKLKKIKSRFEEEIKTVNVNAALATKKELKALIAEAYEQFDPDQIPLRDRIARENGYDYVGSFNRFGLAQAGFERERKRLHSTRDNSLADTFLINLEGVRVMPQLRGGSSQVSAYSEGLAVVTEKHNAIDEEMSDLGDIFESFSYFVDEYGERVDDRIYSDAHPFKFGLALVRYIDEEVDLRKRTYHLINTQGQEVRELVLNFGEELKCDSGYLLVDDNRFGFWYITPTAERLPKDPNQFWEEAGDLNNGIAPVQYVEGESEYYFYLDQQGERLTDGMFSQDFLEATDFVGDFAFVTKRNDNVQCLIDRNGNMIKEFGKASYGVMRKFTQDRIVFDNYDTWSMCDYEGNIILDNADIISHLSEGMGFARFKTEESYLDEFGVEVNAESSQFVLIDDSGQVIELEINIVTPGTFEDGVAFVQYRDEKNQYKECYIDKKGRKVFEN